VEILAANPLQPLIDFFEAILVFFHDTVGLGWGSSIIALTVCVRAALLPLTIKQFRSMQNMAKFQPQIKELQKKYANDRERLNQETMKFYRENKVNPFASCLPLLAQLPVFLALFYMLQNDLRYEICPEKQPAPPADSVVCGAGGDAQFFFIPDLTDNPTGTVLIALIVMYVGSQLASTLLMSTTTDKTQRLIFLALPFIFVPFVINFPAGLLVYWITTNLWTIVQQVIVRKRVGPLRPPGSEPAPGLGELFKQARGQASQAAEPQKTRAKDRELAPAPAGGGGAPKAKARPTAPPPAPPRKKKKRSGRRR
jgi:YidC/Oxa1 family membrane protein insertase